VQINLRFPGHYVHEHPPVSNVNKMAERMASFGDRIADSVAAGMGSWPFIISQSTLLACWLLLNVAAWIRHWDPYPFILLNLALSFQAAYSAPIIMMSQNRQSEKDRLQAQEDYQCNLKAEEEVKLVLAHLEAQDAALLAIARSLARLEERLGLRPEVADMLPPDV